MDKFENILRHKDDSSTNLNKRFSSYGCMTLEAKVPVVNDPDMITKLKGSSTNQQILETLRLKQLAASGAMQGHRPRTRNAVLKVVEINGETIISASNQRERSPVDKGQLDEDIDDYMKEAAKIKALKKKQEIELTNRIIAALDNNEEDEDEEMAEDVICP